MTPVSPRLIYRKLTKSDFDFYYHHMSNDEVVKFISGKPLSLSEATQRFHHFIEINELGTAYGMYGIQIIGQEKLIGLAKFEPGNDQSVELGYSLYPENWGIGFGSEIAQALIQFAQNQKQIDTLIGIVRPDNLASIKILKKFNFHFLEHYIENGAHTDVYILELHLLDN